MTLKRQLLFVSLLTLMLPWAGCQFIRETESALRANQQQMLGRVAEANAETFTQYAEEFPLRVRNDHLIGDQLYGHVLETEPVIGDLQQEGIMDTCPTGFTLPTDQEIVTGLESDNQCILMSPDDTWCITSGRNGDLKVWDLRRRRLTTRFWRASK